MTVVARRIASIPARLASDTWLRIVDLVAPKSASARDELIRLTGVASSLITREVMTDSPIVLAGDGPRVRVYCVYGVDALDSGRLNEAALPSSPAESSTWTLSLPCPTDDLPWVQASLKKLSARVTARDKDEKLRPESDEEASASKASINAESFLRT